MALPVINSGLAWNANTQRDFNTNGETMIFVLGGAHMSGRPIGFNTGGISGLQTSYWELGLSDEAVSIRPNFRFQPLHINDYGGTKGPPAEMLWMGGEVDIEATLYHYDLKVLDACMAESMGGMTVKGSSPNTSGYLAGQYMNMPGIPLGNDKALLASGNHYISILLASPQLNFEWRFPACYMTGPPLEIPLSTNASMVKVNFRSIPYASYFGGFLNNIISSGKTMFNHTFN